MVINFQPHPNQKICVYMPNFLCRKTGNGGCKIHCGRWQWKDVASGRSLNHFVGLILMDVSTHTHYVPYNWAYFVDLIFWQKLVPSK